MELGDRNTGIFRVEKLAQQSRLPEKRVIQATAVGVLFSMSPL